MVPCRSIHVGLNGLPTTFGASGLGIWDPGVSDEWSWKDTMGSRITIDVPSPGTHQFYIWMREDGVRVDSFILTMDANFLWWIEVNGLDFVTLKNVHLVSTDCIPSYIHYRATYETKANWYFDGQFICVLLDGIWMAHDSITDIDAS